MGFFTALAANGVAVSIVGFLFKLWVDKKLSHSLDKKLEEFRSELAKEVSLHTIQSTWNHKKKVELLSQLYESIVDADLELKIFLTNAKLRKKDLTSSRANKFIHKYLEVNSFLHKNALFLEQSLIDEVKESYSPFLELAVTAEGELSDNEADMLKDKLPDSMDEIFDIGGNPRRALVKKFREEIGIG